MPPTLTNRRRAAALALALATVMAIALSVARRLDPIPDGLRAQYFPNADWGGEPARSNPAALPSSDQILADIAGAAPDQPLSAAWNGWLVAPGRGAYTFNTSSSDGSWVYVDGQLVVDNGGAHGVRSKSGPTIVLERGIHPLFIKYFRTSGGPELAFIWQRGSGPFEPVPAWAMRPRQIAYARFVADRVADVAGSLAIWGWIAALIFSAVRAFRPELVVARQTATACRARLRVERAWPALGWIVLASAAINIVGVWWGLPRGTWMGDELIPIEVMSAWAQHFAHGWHDKYPPLHYYLLSLAYAPVIAVDAVFRIPPPVVDTLLTTTGRLLSIVMSAGAVVATFFCGRRAFGARAGLFAAAMLALVTPFSYYAKAANVDMPYLMWFAIALFFYLRVLEGGAATDYFWWAATGTLAVCTKDQAYGLLLFMPVVVVTEHARANVRAGVDRPWWRAIADRRIGIATITALVVFGVCHNVLWNPDGLRSHIRTILEAESYRVYEPTLRGRVALLDVTVRLVERNFGWPMFLVVIAGVVAALATRSRRRTAVWLIVPIVSYYLMFLNVILFAYDRFLLPVCLVLTLFGGYALDRFTAPAAAFGRWRRLAVAGVFAYTFLYSATVDVMMLTDSRHIAERWLAAHVRDDDQIAMSSVATYMPRMSEFNAAEVYDLESFELLRPRFYVLNPEYALTEPPDSPLGRIIGAVRSGADGYRLAFTTTRPPNPLRWLPGGHADLVGDRQDREIVSFLRNISPTIEVYERDPGR